MPTWLRWGAGELPVAQPPGGLLSNAAWLLGVPTPAAGRAGVHARLPGPLPAAQLELADEEADGFYFLYKEADDELTNAVVGGRGTRPHRHAWRHAQAAHGSAGPAGPAGCRGWSWAGQEGQQGSVQPQAACPCRCPGAPSRGRGTAAGGTIGPGHCQGGRRLLLGGPVVRSEQWQLAKLGSGSCKIALVGACSLMPNAQPAPRPITVRLLRSRPCAAPPRTSWCGRRRQAPGTRSKARSRRQ